MGRILGDIKTGNPLSRFLPLAVAIESIIDNTVSPSGTLLNRGTLMAKIVSSGKYRPYFEGTVKSGSAFGTGAATFGFDPTTSPLLANLQIGDALESTAGVALGTVLTYNPVTGAGTLAANSAAVLAAGNTARITEATVSVANRNGRILYDEVLMDSTDATMVGWLEGFFILARTTITAAALAEMGGFTVSTGEIRIG